MKIFSIIRSEVMAMPFGEKKLREFGYLVGVIVIGLAAFFAFLDGLAPAHAVASAIGALLVVLGFAAPKLLTVPYRLWMSLGIIIGYFVFRGLLIIMFLFVFTPIAFIMRIARRDALHMRISKRGPTYWVSAVKSRDMREPY